MINRDKVIKGLECCTKFSDRTCKDCTYQPAIAKIDYLCYNNLMLDALELLKEQEPHVLTLEEVKDALDTVVWVDRPQIENFSNEYALISLYSRKWGYVNLKFIDGDEARWICEQYGKLWRCWSARPTDEQRKAVKWDD